MVVQLKDGRVGSGGKVLHIHAAISHGKGVVLAKSYRKLTGKSFAKFVKREFPAVFKRCEMSGQKRLFLQDGDPSQNSERVRKALRDMNVAIFNISPQSPDLNPIENVFKLLADTLRKDALEKNVERETFRAFRRRVIRTLKEMPREIIDNIIASMPKRIDSIIQCKGGRLKY